jgi:hypothetical protein
MPIVPSNAFLPIAVAAASLLCAAASQSTVSPAFGNTIVSTYPDGRKAEMWLNPDGSYSGQGRRHDPSSGHWQVKGEKLCLKQSRPMPAPFSFCTPLPQEGMQKAWTAKAPTGEPIRVTLVKGRVVPGG